MEVNKGFHMDGENKQGGEGRRKEGAGKRIRKLRA